LALALHQAGFTQVWPLKGGLDAWQQAGLPTVPKD
jgi:rhodanese-related sulfurtransferase